MSPVRMVKDPARVQHRPFLAPIWATILSTLFAVVVLACITWVWGTADSTTVVVVRLAASVSPAPISPASDQLAANSPRDTAGDARAARLSHLFGDPRSAAHIDAIYVTPTPLEQSIAAPLAARLGLDATVATSDASGLARRMLREHAGGRIVVVAPRDHADGLVQALGGAVSLPIGGDEDDLYFVSVPKIGRTNLLHMAF